jgi:hypothetical protein
MSVNILLLLPLAALLPALLPAPLPALLHALLPALTDPLAALCTAAAAAADESVLGCCVCAFGSHASSTMALAASSMALIEGRCLSRKARALAGHTSTPTSQQPYMTAQVWMTVQYSTVQRDSSAPTLLFNNRTKQYSTVQYSTVQYRYG